jgi:hypothetical protein
MLLCNARDYVDTSELLFHAVLHSVLSVPPNHEHENRE